jgi:hypothetical protein
MHPRNRLAARLISVTGALIVVVASLSGCFTTTADFRVDAETFIVENTELHESLFGDSDLTMVSATCDEPANQDEGTTFACMALDSADQTWEFEIVISGPSDYEVIVTRQPTTP